VYWYDDLDRHTMTGGDSGGGASPRSKAAVFRMSAIAAVKCEGLKMKAQGSRTRRNDPW